LLLEANAYNLKTDLGIDTDSTSALRDRIVDEHLNNLDA